MSKISNAIKEAAMRNTKLYCEVATVDSVDEKSRTIECTTFNGEEPLIEVQLQSNVDGSTGVLIVPEVGSEVVLGFLDKNNAFVITYSKIDKVLLDVKNNIVINGGKNNGLVKIEELNNRLESLENKYNQHTHPYVNVSTPATTSATTSLSMEFQGGYSRYENEKIKH